MALSELTQARGILERAARVLLIVDQRPTLDAIASMIALYLVLQSAKEDGVDEVSPSHVPASLQFLPGSSQVLMQPQEQSEVAVDIAGTEAVSTLRSASLQGGVRVHIALPQGVSVTKENVEVVIRQLPYDAVVVLGVADLEALGPVFVQHTDFFYNTPIINVDRSPDNEHFGTVNLVDITTGSVAEATYDLIVSLMGEMLPADIATALYTGIVAGTDSFQRPSTTPHSFQVAARLMELKADREAVIMNLLKTKPLSLLKLTGRLYARLRYDESREIFWSLLRSVDFTESGARPEDLAEAIGELAHNIAGFTATFVLHEQSPGVFDMYLLLGKGLQQRRRDIQEILGATRSNGLLHLQINSPSIEEAEQQALERIHGVVPD
jgi:nanoRNase/pAp phosphatase (c-di-AMP/oligoRNAs hydrolase)